MATINGTAHNDYLLGTAGDDIIDGKGGNDWIEGGHGNDTLTGGRGNDTFVLRAGDGSDVVTDFSATDDRLMFDSKTGVYDGILAPLGALYDGETFSNSHGTATWTVSAIDLNGDGVTDTQISMTDPTGTDTITLLGISPEELTSANIYGG